MDKCTKCLDRKIAADEPFDVADLPDAVVTVPFIQAGPGGPLLAVAIRVCAECRRAELRPGRVQPVQGVIIPGNGRN